MAKMEKEVKERDPRKLVSRNAKAEQQTVAVRVQWDEKDILALQEKARHYQRQYPAGGYQGL